MKKLLAIALGVLLLSGCTVRVADMTVGSTKNYNLNAAKFEKGQRVTGEDKAPIVIFPLGIPSVKTAMDRAIEKDKCAVGLSDVVIYQLNHAFLFGTYGYRVEGTQILDRSQTDCEKR
ncbi:hypothetical protein [Serratia rubidaea]|uniref:Lipoprotein n=1 Tax=Serratia rubidaea TaxID=61652 RepID=A0A3S4WMN6_SERRU|nr:hypothetical protein [Serratia rubidaea]VEI69315.1 Uncharacterised protein [Serratia rubidaea]